MEGCYIWKACSSIQRVAPALYGRLLYMEDVFFQSRTCLIWKAAIYGRQAPSCSSIQRLAPSLYGRLLYMEGVFFHTAASTCMVSCVEHRPSMEGCYTWKAARGVGFMLDLSHLTSRRMAKCLTLSHSSASPRSAQAAAHGHSRLLGGVIQLSGRGVGMSDAGDHAALLSGPATFPTALQPSESTCHVRRTPTR